MNPIKKIVSALLLLLSALLLCAGCNAGQQSETLIEQGNLSLEQQEYAQAVSQFKDALDTDPTNADAYMGLAEGYLGLGRLEKALDILLEAQAFTGDSRFAPKIEEVSEAIAHRSSVQDLFYDWAIPPFFAADQVQAIEDPLNTPESRSFLNICKEGTLWGTIRFEDGSVLFPYAEGGPLFICHEQAGGLHDFIAGLPYDQQAELLDTQAFPFLPAESPCPAEFLFYTYDQQEQPILCRTSGNSYIYVGSWEAESRAYFPYYNQLPLPGAPLSFSEWDLGVADPQGQPLTEALYQEMGRGGDGIIALRQGAYWGYWDIAAGKAITGWEYEPLYDYYDERTQTHVPVIGFFSEGLCPVMQNGKYGYIDTNGQLVIPLEFEGATHVYGEKAWVQQDGLWGQIALSDSPST